jgi:hypothetical protein
MTYEEQSTWSSGVAVDKRTPVGVVGRFADDRRFLMITVYVVT